MSRLLPRFKRLPTAPNGSNSSRWLPTAPYDYKHTLLLFSSSMTPTDFQRLPSRELTPQPHSQIKTWISSNDIKDKRALMDARKLIETKVSA